MDTEMLPPPRWFTSSSSQRVEEISGSTGLPPQASIAGCRASRGQRQEWGASLERLGQERSQVKELLAHLPVPMEESLFQELTAVLLGRASSAGIEQAYTRTDCTFLTLGGQIPSMVRSFGNASVVKLQPAYLPDSSPDNPEDRTPEALEAVVPDTDRAYPVEQMARAWLAIGRPITEDDAALSVDPDDYPLF